MGSNRPGAPGRSVLAIAAGLALVWTLAGATLTASPISAAAVRAGSSGAVAPTQDPGQRPNVLLLISDDQPFTLFGRDLMPNVFSHMVDKGVTFDRAYVDASLCCPSRSQIMTGLFGWHTGVDGNRIPLDRPTIVGALQDLGYRTGLAGKYLNSMPCDPVPQFDDWHCVGHPPSSYHLVNPYMNDNGTWVQHTGYTTDLLADDVVDFIQGTPAGQPWFEMYTPTSPHAPADDPRCTDPVTPYRPPSYDEDTIGDGKPLYVQRGPLTRTDKTQFDLVHTAMSRAVQCLDGSMGTILDYIDANPSLEANTLVVYMSDNGFLYGEHRLTAKVAPYEESVRVPFVVRYPPLHLESQPQESQALVENVDIAATIADVLGFHWGGDGVSFAPLLSGSSTTTRDAVLMENCEGAEYPCTGIVDQDANDGIPSFFGVVTAQYSYTEYWTGEKELYDLSADPYELTNLAGTPGAAQVQADMAARLAELTAPPAVDTTIVTGPSGQTSTRAPTFTYLSQDRRASYRCRVSQQGSVVRDWSPCDGEATTVGGLIDGDYTFEVAGTDSDGATDPTPDARSFSISSTGPDAEITTHPESHQTGRDLSFSFASQSPGVTFSCSIQPMGTPPSFSPCDPAQGATYTHLSDAQWDFQVRASDASGSTDPPAEWLTWVDNVGPTMTFNMPQDKSGAVERISVFRADFDPDEPLAAPPTCTFDALPIVCDGNHIYIADVPNGAHQLLITATDEVGNVRVTAYSMTVNVTPPVVSIDSGPPPFSTSPTATFTYSADSADTFRCQLNGGAYGDCSTGQKQYSGLPDGQHTFCVIGVDGFGNQSDPVCAAWTIDRIGPTVGILSGPPSITNQTTATLVFSTDDPTATLACGLDGAAPTACSSPVSYSALAEGAHGFLAQATDPAGNVGVATWSWTVDTTAPAAVISSGPPSLSKKGKGTFTFDADEPNVTFSCSVDARRYAPCTNPYTISVGTGSHTLAVKATDAAGNLGPASPAYAWTVDKTKPVVAITSAPPDPTNQTTATFVFTSDDPTARSACVLDGSSRRCTSPAVYSNLSAGSHTFTARFTDPAGNVGLSSITWIIDLTPPDATITTAPPDPSGSNVSFGFVADEPATFSCSLDGGTATSCSSGISYSALLAGSHTFAVTPTDPAGNVGQSASYTWSVLGGPQAPPRFFQQRR
jgi:arylsulfatase A-like enzyme